MADGEIKAVVTADISSFETKLKTAEKAAETFRTKLNKSLTGSTGEFVTNLKKDVDAVQKVLPKFKELLQPLKDIGAKLRPINTAFGNLATKLNKVAEKGMDAAISLTDVADALTKADQKLKGITDKISTNTTVTNALVKANKDLTNSTKAAGQATQNSINKTTKQIDVSGRTLDAFADSAALVTGPLGGISSRIQVLNRAFSSGTLSIVGATTALVLYGQAVKRGVQETIQYEEAQRRIQAVLKATGNTARFTKDEMVAFADELALNTLGDSLEIQRAQAQLLSFRGVSRDVFFEVIELSQDLSSAGFGTLAQNAKRLGKAVQSPAKSMEALREIGIKLKPEVLELAKRLELSGNRLEAQRLVLDAVADAVGGVAREIGSDGLAAALDTAGQRASEFFRTLAEESNAITLTQKYINEFANGLHNLTIAIRDFNRTSFTNDKFKDAVAERFNLIKKLEKRMEKVGESHEVFPDTEVRLYERSITKLDKVLEGHSKAKIVAYEEELRLQDLLSDRIDINRKIALLASKQSDRYYTSDRIRGALAEQKEDLEDINKLIVKQAKLVKEARKAAAGDFKDVEEDDGGAFDLSKKQAKIRKEFSAEQNRLNSLRTVSLRSTKEENKILSHMLALDSDRNMSMREFTKNQKEATALIRLGLDGRHKSVDVLKRELAAAEELALANKDSDDAHKSLLAVLKIEAQLRAAIAAGAVKAANDENDLLNEAIRARLTLKSLKETDENELKMLERKLAIEEKFSKFSGSNDEQNNQIEDAKEVQIRLAERLISLSNKGINLSEDQIQAERDRITLMVERDRQLQNITDKTEALAEFEKDRLEAQEKANEAALEFTEKLVSGMTKLIFSGSDFKDVLKDIIANLIIAESQAQLLASVEFLKGNRDSAFTTSRGDGSILGDLWKFGSSILDNLKPSVATDSIGSISGGSSFGNKLNSPLNAVQMHTGGTVGMKASTRKMPVATAINAPRFHDGLRQNEMPAILEKGEEVIPKDQVGRQRRGNTSITFNVSTPNADSFRRSERQLSRQFKQSVGGR